ncbi:organic solvent tolerance protein [Candidatus Pelagibacter bacterium nBUS_49]|uniref:LPS-assembly protein LptD n=1 Tax=Candidatus Pelagibacter bacterium nBUS_49 TaxID=3374196 RepID=UPI003EBC0DE5
MKNNFLIIAVILLFNFIIIPVSISFEQFNFDVTEVEIKEDGNRFLGKKRGTATTDKGMLINADEFDYDKIKNILKINGNIEFIDSEKQIKIYSDKAIYLKQEEKVFTEGNSKGIDQDGTIITAHSFNYNKNLNIVTATGNVKIVDTKRDYIIFAKKITYFRNLEKIITEGKTKAIIESKYTFNSKDVLFLKNEMELSASNYSTIEDDTQTVYELEKFKYFVIDKVLKGKNVDITTTSNSGWYSVDDDIFYSKDQIEDVNGIKRAISTLSNVEWIEETDNYNFKNIITSFKSKKFNASDTKINFRTNIFNSERKKFIELENAKLNELFKDYYEENNPRLYGVSSSGNEKETILKKGVFTSCKQNDSCPAWSFKSKEINHDKIKKNIEYKHVVLNIYDFPVFYFPKFFHPDPTVKRRSGLLRPELRGSKTLGSSLNLPYFHVISDNKDLTFNSTLFKKDMYMFQNEYRQVNENSNLLANFGYTHGYKSSIEGTNKNSLSHIFAEYNSQLNLNNFLTGDLDLFFEKTSNDTYLRVFDKYIKSIKPNSQSTLQSGIKINLDKEEYNFDLGMTAYESLSGSSNDKYQYVLPYYNFSNFFEIDKLNNQGTINFSSSGSNNLKNTNNLVSSLSNNLSYVSGDYFSNIGFKNKFGIYFKNNNVVAKNDDIYKSSVQSELMNLIEFNTSLPLIKKENNSLFNTLTPKLSFRINPTNMKNYSNESRTISVENVFGPNRLGLGGFESGRSITLGLDYKREDLENLEDLEKFFEIKLATVFRDKVENDIPTSSTLNRTSSNIFGSITNNMYDFVKLKYDFSLDNDIQTFEKNSITAEFSVNNFVTKFIFDEQNGSQGNSNTLSNETSLKFNNNNYLTFNTKRNRKTNLTEYYDFVYEYKNDCLTAGISYQKSYYNDRDLRPNEDLLLTLTLFPLTTTEYRVDQNFYRDDKGSKKYIWQK